MAELPEQIKVSPQTKSRLLDKKENEGYSSMEAVVRGSLDEIEKLKLENELLSMKLKKCEEKKEQEK